MAFIIDNTEYCKAYIDGIEYCAGYIDGVKVFGCVVDTPPTVVDSVANLTSNIFTFSTASFTNGFADTGGDSFERVYIEALPIVGTLKLFGNPVTVGTNFLAVNASGLKFHLDDKYSVYNFIIYEYEKSITLIVAEKKDLGYNLTSNIDGLLTFTNSTNSSDVISIQGVEKNSSFMSTSFRITDDSVFKSKSNLADHNLNTTATNINIEAVYENLPPTVGDTFVAVEPTGIVTYTVADFTTKSSPNYSDPENDDAYEMLIVSLPEYGKLQLRGVDVIIEQILSFANDISVGELKYVPDSTRLETWEEWHSKISDYGSKIFVY